ncbi:MAG: FMN-binding negative transcriptional regulator [Parvularculaceae bacterium]
MYRPPHYRIDDDAAAFRLIADHAFATLATVANGAPKLSQLPIIADNDRRVLRGHLARANPHSALLAGARGLALFAGADGYISPNWYVDRARVPTWDYQAVEVEGVIQIIDAPGDVDQLLTDLSHHFECRRHDLDRDVEWTIDKLPEKKRSALRNGIAAFELQIERIEMKAKLNQKDNAADRDGAIAALSSGDESQRKLADAMREAAR